MTIQLAPSLLSADFAALGEAVRLLEGTVDIFHVDIMDGHFVPNLTIGPPVVRSLRKVTDGTLDVHLMVEDPDRWIEPFRDAGADWISFHIEAANHAERTMSRIRELGARAGIVLNPATPTQGLEYLLESGDFVLIMTVNPGFGGQAFLPRMLDKISGLRADLDSRGLTDVPIEIDGGVGVDNVADCVRAGAEILVAGSSVYGARDPIVAARALIEKAAEGQS